MKFIILFFLAVAVNANYFDLSHNWKALRVSWYANPVSSWGFDKMPRHLAESKAFQQKDDMCADGGKKFVGYRYWYKQDPALILLFDRNGVIAGLQTSAPKSKFTPPANLKDKYYIDDGDYWTLTSYFVDPSTICKGRTSEDLEKQGTGTGLWLQYGQDPIKDSIRIPTNEADIKETNWGSGKCFYTMGQHYWLNVSKGMDCGDFVPNCLLYNKGKLTGFCFAKNVNLVDQSNRYDSPAPTNKVVGKFLNPVPDCMFKDPSYFQLSTLHVYFTQGPRLTSWC